MAHYKQPSRINAVSMLLGLVAIGAIYVAAKFGPHYWRERKVAELLGVAVNHFYRERSMPGVEDAIRADLDAKIRALGVEDPELRILVERTPNLLRVSASYTVVISHPGHKITTLRFAPSAQTDTKSPFD